MTNYTLQADTGIVSLSQLDANALPVPAPPLENRPRGYTCPTCMARLFSSDGIDLRTDDGLDTREQDLMLEDAIMDATDLINQYCLPIYHETELHRSRWVSRRACYLACHFLSQRRGNPAQYQARHDAILEELGQVQRTNLYIPRLKVRNEITPSMSNLIVDDRYVQDSLRVERSNSFGTTYSGQDLDHGHGAYGCGCGFW